MCEWLFGKVPSSFLPESVYRFIASDMVQNDGKWVFDAQQAAASTQVAAAAKGINIEPFPGQALELLLKNIYRGMHKAHMRGMVDSPQELGLSADVSGASGNLFVAIGANGKVGLFFVNLPTLQETLRQFDGLLKRKDQSSKLVVKSTLASWEKIGFTIQCHAHFLHNNRELYVQDNKQFSKQLNEYLKAQQSLYERSLMERN